MLIPLDTKTNHRCHSSSYIAPQPASLTARSTSSRNFILISVGFRDVPAAEFRMQNSDVAHEVVHYEGTGSEHHVPLG